MDIANNIGMTSNTSRLAGFTVTLAGLTDNTTFGPCAERGVPLQAQTSGWEGATPVDLSYQWYASGDPIAGAVGDSFIPDAPLVPGTAIFCEVSAPGKGSRRSAPSVFRDIAPQLGTPLFNEIFDLDTGMQTLAAAGAFTGLNLTFSVTGAGAVIDPDTGELSVPTDIEVDGAQIIVTAANTGGDASAAFQITVENVALSGAIPFGGLTPAGAGGLPVDGIAIVQGDPGGHWEITGGLLVPTAAGEGALAGVYPLVFDNGDTLDVLIEDDKASARVEELETVFAGLPTTARGLMVQDGDARPLGRLRLPAKIFENEMVLEPTNWLEDADPRASLRPVTLGGLTIGGDPSGDALLRMENLTVQGFECQLETGVWESETNNGIILVERPSRHVTIRQNEIWSRDTREIIVADDYRDNVNTSRQMRGISTKVHAGTNERICIEVNYIHSVTRGVIMTDTSAYDGIRSRLCSNIIEHCYTNFFTAGFLDGLDIFDNRCMGVYAAIGDTLDGNIPHSAAGGSFDTSGSRRTQNVSVMGNLLHIGWLRTKLCAELGLPKPAIGATGMKFNDPRRSDSYYNLAVAFNVIVAHGPALAIDGADADTHNLVFNNSLVYENYAANGSPPTISLGGAQNLRMFNNLSTGYYINNEDGASTVDGARTLSTLEGYGNIYLGLGNESLGEKYYFVGDVEKGLANLTLDEALTAYIPKAETRAMSAEQKKGALGTGLYHGDGVHDVIWNKVTPSGGISHNYVATQWDGQYMTRPGNAAMLNTGAKLNGLTFAFKGVSDASLNSAAAQIFALSGQRLYITKTANGTLIMKVEDGNKTFLEGYSREGRINSTYGVTNYIFSADFYTGTLLFAANGTLTNWYTMREFKRDDLSLDIHSPRIFANEFSSAESRWQGHMELLYLADTFVDLETQAGLDSFFASDGQFRDFGADGSAPTGQQPLLYVKDDAGTIRNLGKGGNFTVVE